MSAARRSTCLSDLSAGVTGTVHFVDAGYHAIGMPPAGGANGPERRVRYGRRPDCAMRSIILLLARRHWRVAMPPVVTSAEPLTPVRLPAESTTAKAYAADRTLVFYCIRNEPEMVPFNYFMHITRDRRTRSSS